MEESSKITIKSIAREAGVSIGTVSNVLNGTGRVAEDTILKVKKVAEALKYTPNSSARNLRAQKSHLIALIVPFLEKSTIHDSPFYWNWQPASRRGRGIIICMSCLPDLIKIRMSPLCVTAIWTV